MDYDYLYYDFLDAIEEDNVEKIKNLEKNFLKKKHDIDIMSFCSQYDSFKCLKYFCENEDKYNGYICINPHRHKSALEYACINNNMNIVKYLTSKYPGQHNKATLKTSIKASLAGNLDITQYLLNELKYRNIYMD